MNCRAILVTLILLVNYSLANAQSSVKNWHLLDPKKDNYYGIGLDNTYELLQGHKYKPLIVAVIDSGIDTTHEDLKDVLWTNTKEIPGNGIDDDHNGYVDDVHGWNFLGNKNGENLKKDVDERTRIYYRFKDKFSKKGIDEDTLSDAEKEQYHTWQKAAEGMKVSSEDQLESMLLDMTLKAITKHDKVLQTEMQQSEYSREELENFEPKTNEGKKAKIGYLTLLKLLSVDEDEKNTTLINELNEETESRKAALSAKATQPPNYREEIIKDDYYNIDDRYYGNSDVMGPGPMHGTHVSGIIAAERDNNIGAEGIADHVQIMMIRAVPEGDEYDKDIALAIKYAVDNGAKVINMSFGKSFSPEKQWVDEAVHYAEMKDVLIVHAAGNEAEDVDKKDNFPNADLKEFQSHADNFITVGASGDLHIGNGKLIAAFSNYGKNSVDVFAPGVKIYSTLPGGNNYGYLQGTSMAAPVVTGIAALIRTYFPDLSAQQVKYAIEKSAQQISDSVQVMVPGTDEMVPMSELCTSGGVVNAYAAVKLAATLKPEPQEKKTQELPKATLKNLKLN